MRMIPRNLWVLSWMAIFAASPYLAAQVNTIWIPGHGLSVYFQQDFLKVDQGKLYAMDQSKASDRWLRRSGDLGDTWDPVGPRFPSYGNIAAMEMQGSQIFLLTWGDGVWRLASPEDTAWMRVNVGLRNLDSLNHMALSGSTLLLAAEYGFYSWSAGFGGWVPAGEAIPGDMGSGMTTIAVAGTTLFATDTQDQLYRGAPTGQLTGTLTVTEWTWSKLPFRGGKSVLRKGRYLFAAGSPSSNMKYSVYRSGDDGITWQKKAVGLPTDELLTGGPVPLAKVGENLFATFYNEGIVYRSADDGETWTPYAGRPENRYVYIQVLEAVGSDLLAMSDDGLFRLSTGFSSIRPTSGRGRAHFRLGEGSRSLQFQFESPGWVRLGLFSATGRAAIPVFQGHQAGGTRVFPLTPGMRPGAYLLRVETVQGAASHVLRIK